MGIPEDIFRLVITIAVLLACIAFVVQAAVAVAFYRAVRKIQETTEDLVARAEPLMAKIEPVVEKIGPVIDKAVPIVERLGPILDNATVTIESARPAIAQAMQLMNKVGAMVEQAIPVVENARQMVANANQVIVDTRPKVAEFSAEAVGGIHSVREQVDRIGGLLNDASGRARARLEQIDRTVEHSVDQVGQLGENVKRAVMRPVREANGLAAGISAAVSTLVNPRKSPDSATQDEEMFI
jgi:hypothetical protein